MGMEARTYGGSKGAWLRGARTSSVVLGLLSFALVACAPDPEAPRPAGGVDMTRVLDVPLDPGPVIARMQEDAKDQPPAQAREVVQLVGQQGVRLFDREPPRGYLDEIEVSFFATGRTLELADLYREAVDAQGEGSWMRPRLAWIYQRLGLYTAAERESRRAVEEDPDDSNAHFVRGFVLGQDEVAADEELARIAEHFRRALELDPDLLAPGGVTAGELRREIRAIEERIESGVSPVDAGDADAHTHDDGALELDPAIADPPGGPEGAPPLAE